MNWPSYHLWIKLPSAERARVLEAIVWLSNELGGPVFEPHVTLSSALQGPESELVRATEALARQLIKFELVSMRHAVGTEYFRCIYLEVELTRTLARARAVARQLFAQSSDPFMPHLSLAYGTLDTTRKRAAVEALPASLPARLHAETLTLVRAEDRDPSTWREICEARLGELPAPRA